MKWFKLDFGILVFDNKNKIIFFIIIKFDIYKYKN
jgi:hypothetical protein